MERHHDGSFTLSQRIEGDQLVKRRYFDYTYSEAKKDFAEYVKKEKAKNFWAK